MLSPSNTIKWEELDIELEGKKLTQRDSFVYLVGVVCGDGMTEREVRRRVQAGANACRSVEGVMADRRISKRLKGKVMSTCVLYRYVSSSFVSC